MTLLSRMHLSVEAKYDSEHFSVFDLTLLSIEVEFLSETRTGLISSAKSNFRDQDQIFWLGRTPGKSNPNLLLNQKTSSVEI